ncbi:MAG: protein-glutamine glutaminase family protein [Anaerolineaceae bacterium]
MAESRETDLVTVAAIRKGKGNTQQYLLNERQRIFVLADKAAAKGDGGRLLTEALEKRTPVKVTLDTGRPVIQRVVAPTSRELEAFAKTRIPLPKAQTERNAAIDVAKIDPTRFNIVDAYLKWRCFRLCTRVIPSYAKAKEIFDFCAQLSCHLPGPYAVQPCIPFQYVRDGCYARAHQMRRLITTRYRYCCEKVFSYAPYNDDVLAVQANKWGGCCVEWWYHVAPLVRVRVKLRLPQLPKEFSIVLAMVIDPGMFDKPVLLSTWLAAQENKTCNPQAKVSAYSIQPGSAYTPGWSGPYGTDPNYVATEATLLAYQNLTTC